jgi:hypothetical protein
VVRLGDPLETLFKSKALFASGPPDRGFLLQSTPPSTSSKTGSTKPEVNFASWAWEPGKKRWKLCVTFYESDTNSKPEKLRITYSIETNIVGEACYSL